MPGLPESSYLYQGEELGLHEVADFAAAAQQNDHASSLSIYRRAPELRRALRAEEKLEWMTTGRTDVLHYRCPNGWEAVTNFGPESFRLDRDDVLVASTPIQDNMLPADSTVWFAT